MSADDNPEPLIRWLDEHQAHITTDALRTMEHGLEWFSRLDAQERSWVTVVVQQGIDGFRDWLAQPRRASAPSLFEAAPQALTRRISLRQTVELVRVAIGVVEDAINALTPSDARGLLELAVLQYSREIAFAAADVYARAAESRGSWDARMEALVVDAVVRAETDESLLSRASALGWLTGQGKDSAVCVVVGAALPDADSTDQLRRAADRTGLSALVATQGTHLVMILGGAGVADEQAAVRAVAAFEQYFGQGKIVVGPPVADLASAYISARAANSGVRAAVAWPDGPRTIAASELLPERALAGDGHARRELSQTIYQALADAGGDLLTTCSAFLGQGGSVEGTARALFVHPNTVRYRLKRIHEVTGYSPSDPRGGYVLRLALTLGRLRG